MKALVTGAAGFIGSNVVRALLADGHEVRAMHLPTDDLRNLRGLDCELFAGDVTDAEGMKLAVRGCTGVFHLAAVYALWERTPGRMQMVNVEGTRNVLEAADGRRVVHTSSIARFGGQGPGKQGNEQSAFALGSTGDVYSRTKYEAHQLALSYAKRGMDVVIVAPTGPIGPGDVGPTPTGKLLLSCLELPIPLVAESVSNVADVRDMARGHVLAYERGRAGESYLLGAHDVSFTALARLVMELSGRNRPVIAAPISVALLVGHVAKAWSDHVSHKPPLVTPSVAHIAKLGLAADASRAQRELDMPTRSVEASVRSALAWFAREGYVRDAAMKQHLRSLD